MNSEEKVKANWAEDAAKKPASDASINQLEHGVLETLSEEHRDYLLQRHGTVDLVPLPSADPHDPLNWPSWKKHTNLILVSFHALMTTFTAAGIIPAFEMLSTTLNVSLTQASYLTSIQIVTLGIAPLFWKPLSNHYGRRPIWLLSTLGSCICNIGCANSHSYGVMMVCRVLVAFWISPAIAIGSAVVVELFFAAERGKKMGVWTLLVTLGPPLGPFIMGFVAYHTGGFEWIYYTCAIINAIQFILYFLFSPETLYARSLTRTITTTTLRNRLSINILPLSSQPLHIRDFLTPLKLFSYPTILLPTITYTLIFGFASVMLTVEIPQLFIPKFGFNDQQIGLQFLGMIIGSVLGEQLSGYGSDLWMRYGLRSRSTSTSTSTPQTRGHEPEFRLWLSYLGITLSIIGLIVFCIQTQNAPQGHWNVTPIVGIAIAGFGHQIVATIVVTYVVDCHPEQAASIGVFVNLIRSTWGFLGPFWFPDMFSSLGLDGTAGLVTGILAVVGIGLIVVTQVWGKRMRVKGE